MLTAATVDPAPAVGAADGLPPAPQHRAAGRPEPDPGAHRHGGASSAAIPAAGGGAIFGGITDNGLFAALAAYLVVTPLFLPLGVAVVAGDAIAGEAQLPARCDTCSPFRSGGPALLAVKFGGICSHGARASVVGVGVGGVVIGCDPVPVRTADVAVRTHDLATRPAVIGWCWSRRSSPRRWRWSLRWGCSSRR